MSDSYQLLQVKSSGQYLNVFQKTKEEGRYACQGVDPTTENFYWELISSPVNSDYLLLKVKYSGMYLNVLNNSKLEGATIGQNSLANINEAPDNFLWKKVDVTNKPGWFLLQAKSSSQYLMISYGNQNNGDPAVQGVVDEPQNPISNTIWQIVGKDSKPVKVSLQVDCESVYKLPEGKLTDEQADSYLEFSDDNNGRKETGHQSSFVSTVNPGSSVKWKGTTKQGQNDDYSITIDSISYDPGTGTGNIFSPGLTKSNGSLNAQVSWTVLTPETGDNEFYTVGFTIEAKKGDDKGKTKSYTVDPRMKVMAKDTTPS